MENNKFYNRVLSLDPHDKGWTLGALLAFLSDLIRRLFSKIGSTKAMRSVNKVVGYIPEKIADNVTYRKRQVIWGIVFILPLLIGFVYFFLIPFIMTIGYSFSFIEIDGGVKTTWIGFANYRYLLEECTRNNVTFAETVLDAIKTTCLNIPIILIFSLIMAVVLNSKFKGRAFVRAIFFMPVIFNSQAINMVISGFGETLATAETNSTTDLFAAMFNMQEFMMNAGIPPTLVTYLSGFTTIIYDVISYSGVQILIFLSAIQAVPKHLYEAAKMEGATQYEIFWKITFPMVSPMMVPAGVYTVVDSFMRSTLIDEIKYYIEHTDLVKSKLFGTLSAYGVNAAISMIFALISILIIAIVLLILSRMVFYYDE